MDALSADELVAWVERTTSGWRELLKVHSEILGLPCDVRESTSVSELVHHIVAVELRYAQRLSGVAESGYEEIAKDSAEEMYEVHDQAMAMLRERMAEDAAWWEESIRFATRSAGTLTVTRRTVLVHALMHSIRHYAQLATLVRQHGVHPGWPMDYLFMGVQAG